MFIMFTPKIGEDESDLTIIFFNWVVQPPTNGMFVGVPPSYRHTSSLSVFGSL